MAKYRRSLCLYSLHGLYLYHEITQNQIRVDVNDHLVLDNSDGRDLYGHNAAVEY